METMNCKTIEVITKLHRIANFDWSKTKHTLTGLFEHRKYTAQRLIECHDEEGMKNLHSMMEYCTKQIKEILYL